MQGRKSSSPRPASPYARLVPLAPDAMGRRLGSLAGRILDNAFFDDLPEEELEAWER